MAANRAVWGIDLGQCALKAIRVRAGAEGKVEVLDHVYHEHEKILSQPDADRPALIAAAMKKLTEEHDLSKDLLVVGVPGQHTLARFTKLPPVDKKKIPEIVKYEAQQQIPFDMEEVIWDYQVFQNPEAMETQVGIFAMRRDLLREHLRPLSNLNLEPGAVQASPLALFNAMKYDGLCGSEPVCILDIGAQNTDLIVVEGESLWTRNIPIGGNNFTEALLKTFKVSFRKAEKLKRGAQKHKYARQIFQAMRPAFADLVAEVQRSIGFFTQNRRGVELNKIIAMGNAFKLPGMVKFVQQNLNRDVVRPTTFNKLAVSEAPNAPQLIDQLLSFGVAYGLGLQGLGLGQITSNLVPPEIAKQVVWRKKTPWFYGVAACLLLSAGIVWGVNVRDEGIVAKGTGGPTARSDPPAGDPYEVIEKGPRDSLPVKLQAKQVMDAAQRLRSALEEVLGANQKELSDAKEIIELKSNKLVWPMILHRIHEALPQLEGELGEKLKEGPEAYRKLIESDKEKYDRGKREQIFIEELTAKYSPDVMSVYNNLNRSEKSSSSPQQPGTGREVSSFQTMSGFLIRMKIRTPHQEKKGMAVVREFLDKLPGPVYPLAGEGDGAEEPERPEGEPPPRVIVELDQVQVLGRDQVRSERGSYSAKSTGGPAGGMAGTLGGPEVTVVAPGRVDRVTGEPIDNDWVFDVVLVAIPDGKTVSPASPAGGYVPDEPEFE